MIKKKKFLALTLTISMLASSMFLSPKASAKILTTSKTGVNLITSTTSSFIDAAASNEFSNQISSILDAPEKYGFNSSEVKHFKLGHAFTFYYYNDSSLKAEKGYSYPVLYGNKIRGIFSLVKNSNGEFTSTLTKSFSEKLSKLNQDNFIIVNANNNIFAVSKNNSILLEKSTNKSNSNFNKLTSTQLSKINSLIKSQNTLKEDITKPIPSTNNINFSSKITAVALSKTLPVPIVLQEDHPWCWAATCAALINYDKNLSITKEDVVNYIFGSLVEEGGSDSDIMNVYTHWGLSPKEYTSPLSYNQTVSYINNNDPLNTLMYYDEGASDAEGHSMSLIGYSSTRTGYKTYKMIDPNMNYYVSVNATTSGSNIYYSLDGYDFYWSETIAPIAE